MQLIARVMEFPDVDVPVRAGQLRELAAPLKHASISDLSVGCEVMVIADPDSMHDNGNAAEQRRRRLRGATEGILFGRRGTVLQVNLQAKMVDVSFVLPEQPGRAEQRFERSLPEACLQSPEQLKFWRNAMDDPGEYGNDANVVDFLDTPTPAENFRLHAVQRATTTPGNSASSPHARSRAPTVHKMDDLRRPPRRSPEEHPDEILDRQHKRAQRCVCGFARACFVVVPYAQLARQACDCDNEAPWILLPGAWRKHATGSSTNCIATTMQFFLA